MPIVREADGLAMSRWALAWLSRRQRLAWQGPGEAADWTCMGDPFSPHEPRPWPLAPGRPVPAASSCLKRGGGEGRHAACRLPRLSTICASPAPWLPTAAQPQRAAEARGPAALHLYLPCPVCCARRRAQRRASRRRVAAGPRGRGGGGRRRAGRLCGGGGRPHAAPAGRRAERAQRARRGRRVLRRRAAD